MRSYELFSSHDFIADDVFIEWVNHPTEASDSFWRQWLQQHPYKQPEVDEAVRMIKELSSQPDVFSEDELAVNWQQIQQKIAPFTQVERSEETVVIPLWRRWYSIAAAVTVLILAGVSTWWYQQPISYATAYGHMRTVVLPDGSVVTMNGNSQLRYYRGWGWRDREIQLTGEALFRIKKQQQSTGLAKFTVKTNRLSINVLGTVFTVNDRRGNVEVVLQEGKVQLDGTSQKTVMVPGEKATLLATSNEIVKEQVDTDQYTAWLHNMLIFNGATLASIFQHLEDGYGIHTTVKRSGLLQKRFTGTVPTDSVAGFYNQLQTIYNVHVKPVKGGYLVD